MANNKNLSAGSLLAAGLAAYAYYKYTKMSDEQKRSLVGDLKSKAQDIYDQYVPEEIKDVFAKKGPGNATSHFGEGGGYTN